MIEAHAMGLEIIDRCNLTVLQEPGQEDLVSFLAQHKVQRHPSRLCESWQELQPQDLPVKGESDMQHGRSLHREGGPSVSCSVIVR